MRRFALLTLFVSWSAALCAQAQLTASDVQRVINQAAKRANKIAPSSVIAVTNREGYVLGVWIVRGGEPSDLEVATAVGKAGTAAFLSSNSNAFSTRTAGYIIQQHFPPGVHNLPPGPLVGVGFSNLPFSDVNRFKKPDFIASSASPGTLGSPIPLTSLNGIPGGVPLYKDGALIGGVGVTGSGVEFPPSTFVSGPTRDEDIALAGQKGFEPPADILASDVFINGIALPYVESSAGSISGGVATGNTASQYPIVASPPGFAYPVATLGGVTGQMRQPIMSDPISTPINGQPRLTSAEVTHIIEAAAARVRTTRAGIRLPIGSRMEAFITVVNNPNTPGVSPAVLGTFRTGDATIFSWDVAVQKARTAVGFSNNQTAYSTRTVGFLAQSHFPPGIDPESPGPFQGLQEALSGFDATALPNLAPTPALTTPPFVPPNPKFPNGITIFPGGFPLYRNGQLIGALGVSGDGVDQDDIVAASGTSDFLPPDSIRADQFSFDGTRLPYAKFPRDPEGLSEHPPVVLPAFAALTTGSSAELVNLSVRAKIDRGERLMIGGFIITGASPKSVIVRALGPSLSAASVSGVLLDPALELHDAGGTLLAQNFDWRDSPSAELATAALVPSREAEAAFARTLGAGAYTAGVTGQDGGVGVGLLEIYDTNPSLGARLANLSARGYAGTADEVMIGGFMIRGAGLARLIVRALGPSLADRGVAEPLADPMLEIHDGNGALLAANNDWRETQETEIRSTGLAPEREQESAALMSVPAGAYTAVLRGFSDGNGVALLEIYRLD